MVKRFFSWLKETFTPFGLVLTNLRSLVGFEIMCRLLAIMVFFPILTWMQRLFLLIGGTNTIAAYNVTGLLKNPLTWLVLVVMCFLIVIFAMFERLALVDALHASKCGLRRTVRQIFNTGFDLCVERFRLSNWGLVPYTIFVLHFGMILDISSVTSFIKIPGFILEDFEKRPWEKYAYYALICVLLYLSIRWIFSIPLMMEEDRKDFSKARKKSWKMTKGFYALYLFILYAMWAVISELLYVVIAFGAVSIWYLLSLWLQPGLTPGYIGFLEKNYMPTFMVATIVVSWLVGPVMLASFQSAYYKRKEALGDTVNGYTEEPCYLKTRPALKAVVVFVVAVCVFFSGPRRFAQVKWMMNTQYGVPMIMAHRGYSSAAPENTLPAFAKAIAEGFTAAELDVQMTKDGVIVVLHDSNLKRTTGLDKNIWEVTFDEISDLDNGSFFSKEYAGTPIPTLDEVLKLCRDRLYLNIEIKRTGHDEGITEKVIDLILENDFLDQCDITSQDYSTIEEVKEINPHILTAYTSVIGIGALHQLEAADIISIQETFATYENIYQIHNAGKRVFVWTINEEDTMEEMISLNVDAILTNDPGLCKEVIDEYSSNVMNVLRRIRNIFEYM